MLSPQFHSVGEILISRVNINDFNGVLGNATIFRPWVTFESFNSFSIKRVLYVVFACYLISSIVPLNK